MRLSEYIKFCGLYFFESGNTYLLMAATTKITVTKNRTTTEAADITITIVITSSGIMNHRAFSAEKKCHKKMFRMVI